MVKILIGCTGSVASLKIPILIENLISTNKIIEVSVITTKYATHFFDVEETSKIAKIYGDDDEWSSWSKRGDQILHIDLCKWADLFLIAPLDANTLAKISNGLCDNLLTCAVRAWDINKPLVFCPAMNTKMYEHPITSVQITTLESWGYKLVPVIEKTLVCGDTGIGAMAEISTIVNFVNNLLEK